MDQQTSPRSQIKQLKQFSRTGQSLECKKAKNLSESSAVRVKNLSSMCTRLPGISKHSANSRTIFKLLQNSSTGSSSLKRNWMIETRLNLARQLLSTVKSRKSKDLSGTSIVANTDLLQMKKCQILELALCLKLHLLRHSKSNRLYSPRHSMRSKQISRKSRRQKSYLNHDHYDFQILKIN